MTTDEILAAVTDEAKPVDPPLLAMALSAFVKQRGDRRDPRVQVLLRSLEKHATKLRSRDLSTVLVASRRLGKPPASLVSAMCKACCDRSGDLDAQAIANTLNAVSQMGHSDAALVSRLSEAALGKAGEFNPQNIASTLWSLLALSDLPNRACVSALWGQLECQDASAWSVEELSQLHIAQLCLGVEHPGWNLNLPTGLAAAAQGAWWTSLSEAKSSRLHGSISQCLTDLGVVHENEVEAGGLSVDIAVRDASGVGGLVVEVDGPAHYCVSRPNLPQQPKMLGQYVFKHRLLTKQGWRVVCVPYFEWDALADGAQREAYLQAELRSAQPHGQQQ